MQNITRKEFVQGVESSTNSASHFDKNTLIYTQMFFNDKDVYLKYTDVSEDCLDEDHWGDCSWFVKADLESVDGNVGWTVDGLVKYNFEKGE